MTIGPSHPLLWFNGNSYTGNLEGLIYSLNQNIFKGLKELEAFLLVNIQAYKDGDQVPQRIINTS